jgi:molybdenum cofactor cytidylyltransferase
LRYLAYRTNRVNAMATPPVDTNVSRPSVAAILLAAGSSRRYGAANKLLAELDGRPLLTRMATALVEAGFDPIIVVTGHDAKLIRHALAPFGDHLQFAYNARHNQGMGSSIASGIAVIGNWPNQPSGVLIAQGDMPDVSVALLTTLTERFRGSGADRVTVPWLPGAPGIDTGGGRQGNPVIWPRRLLPALATLTGDRGGKALMQAEGDAIERVISTDVAAAVDIDTPDQLAAYIKRSPSDT